MLRSLSFISLFLVLASVNCKKDNPAISIDGLSFYDENGSAIFSTDDGDWKLRSSLSQREMDLFNFTTPYNLDNTTQAVITAGIITPAPNPVKFQQRYYVNVSDSVLMKVVIVDNNLNVKKTAAIKSKGNIALAVDLSDRNIFPNGHPFRVYYSFSVQGKPNYQFGYGDILICDNFGQDLQCR